MGLRYDDTKQVNLTYSSNHHINRPFLAPLYMSRNAGGDALSPARQGRSQNWTSHFRVAQMPRFQSEAKCEAFHLKMIFKFSYNKKGFDDFGSNAISKPCFVYMGRF